MAAEGDTVVAWLNRLGDTLSVLVDALTAPTGSPEENAAAVGKAIEAAGVVDQIARQLPAGDEDRKRAIAIAATVEAAGASLILRLDDASPDDAVRLCESLVEELRQSVVPPSRQLSAEVAIHAETRSSLSEAETEHELDRAVELWQAGGITMPDVYRRATGREPDRRQVNAFREQVKRYAEKRGIKLAKGHSGRPSFKNHET